MLAGNQQQNRNRAQVLIERARNAYNNTGKIKRFINAVLLVSMIPLFFLLIQFLLYSWLVDYFLKPRENESKLSAWPKNIVRVILKAVLVVCIIISCIFLVLPMVFLRLLNRTLVEEIRQFFNLVQEAPEEERQIFVHDLINVLPFVVQTTHDPNAVSSINLSVDKLIEKYKENLSKEEFYTQLNGGNTIDIEEYIKQSNEFKEDEKSQALECLKFINRTTGDSFKDNYSQLTLKQAAILCWKACNDRSTGTEDPTVPLSDKDIKNGRDMFVRGLIDAATTYGNQGQSCAGGTYNKLFESLAGLHPLVVITLNEKEASNMVKGALMGQIHGIAKEDLGNLSQEEQNKIQNELQELSSETVRHVVTIYKNLEKKCKQFSGLSDDGRKEILDSCINNFPLGNQIAPDFDEEESRLFNEVKSAMSELLNGKFSSDKNAIIDYYKQRDNQLVNNFIGEVKEEIKKGVVQEILNKGMSLDRFVQKGFEHFKQVKSILSQPRVNSRATNSR